MPMITVFTQNDLIRFLYHETSEEENREIKRALQFDSELSLQWQELQTVVKRLDDTELQPAEHTVEKILTYSKEFR